MQSARQLQYINSYKQRAEVARIIASSAHLGFMKDEPFTFTSGWKSPVYVNMRALLGRPVWRDPLLRHACVCLTEQMAIPEDVVFVGGETAGIPYAAMLAVMLDREFAYVRKSRKGFGQNRLVEGAEIAGKQVILIEDLTTDGKSKLAFVETLRNEGAIVNDVFSAFYYGVEDITRVLFSAYDLRLTYLASWRDLLELPSAELALTEQQRAEAQAFLSDPQGWNKSRVD